MPKKITVLLVDDHALVRRGFRLMLEDHPDIEVVGEASDGAAAVSVATELHPQLVVMDCALPNMNGIEATRRIRAEMPDVAVLMLSMYSEHAWVRRALEAGANGYILKSADLDLADAIKRVAEGETVLDPGVAPLTAMKGERTAGLSDRELEVLLLIVSGKSNKEIAT
jgi:DNA-binding NarL/FixJ family response regulator